MLCPAHGKYEFQQTEARARMSGALHKIKKYFDGRAGFPNISKAYFALASE
jgi:hypothetical protein